jgi:hypothetical protein
VVLDDPKNPASAHLVRSTAVGALVLPHTVATASSASPRRRLAADVVHGRTIDDVAHEIADAWKSTHAQ